MASDGIEHLFVSPAETTLRDPLLSPGGAEQRSSHDQVRPATFWAAPTTMGWDSVSVIVWAA
jgi:hypothetical protein